MGVAGAAACRRARSSSPASPACWPAPARWRSASGSRCRARASSPSARSRSRRDELDADPRRGARGAGADLPGQGPATRAGARAGRPPDRRSRRPRSTRSRARSSASTPTSWAARPGWRRSPRSSCSRSARSFRSPRSSSRRDRRRADQHRPQRHGPLRARRAITLMTGRGVLFSGMRQLVIGVAAAALTFGVGSAIGAAVG